MLKGKQSRGPSCGADRLGTRGVGREASPAGGREGSFRAMGPSETPPLEGLCRGTGSCKARHAVGSRRPRSRPTRQEGQMPAPSVRGLGGRSSQGASVRRRVRAVAGPGGPRRPGVRELLPGGRARQAAPDAARPLRRPRPIPATRPAPLTRVPQDSVLYLGGKLGDPHCLSQGGLGARRHGPKPSRAESRGAWPPAPGLLRAAVTPSGSSLPPDQTGRRPLVTLKEARPLAPYLISTNNPRQRCPRSPKYLPSPEPLIPSFPDGRLSVRGFSTQFR